MTGGPNFVNLSCASPLNVGDFQSCIIVASAGYDDITVDYWVFVASQDVQGHYTASMYWPPSGDFSWTGPMVVSGTVWVWVHDGLEWHNLSHDVTVIRREWSWANLVGGRRAQPGEIDVCVDYLGVSGLTAGDMCTGSSQSTASSILNPPGPVGGYNLSSVSGTGPNGNFYYVSFPFVTMNLLSQVRRLWRADAPADLPMTGDTTVVNACGPDSRNHFYVNITCAPQIQYSQFMDYAWTHEDAHRAEGIQLAKQPSNDLHARWEPLVVQGTILSLLDDELNFRRADVKNAIWSRMQCTHTGVNTTFTFWRNQGSGWQSQGFTVDESIPPHC